MILHTRTGLRPPRITMSGNFIRIVACLLASCLWAEPIQAFVPTGIPGSPLAISAICPELQTQALAPALSADRRPFLWPHVRLSRAIGNLLRPSAATLGLSTLIVVGAVSRYGVWGAVAFLTLVLGAVVVGTARAPTT